MRSSMATVESLEAAMESFEPYEVAHDRGGELRVAMECCSNEVVHGRSGELRGRDGERTRRYRPWPRWRPRWRRRISTMWLAKTKAKLAMRRNVPRDTTRRR